MAKLMRENNPNWRGGVSMRFGYRFIKAPNHHRAGSDGYVQEHVLVAEGVLGKPLPVGAVVHHVNGDKSDNRPCNLVICESAHYHNLLHRRLRALEECGNANKLRCARCGEYDEPGEAMYVSRRSTSVRAYHRECQKIYQKRLRSA